MIRVALARGLAFDRARGGALGKDPRALARRLVHVLEHARSLPPVAVTWVMGVFRSSHFGAVDVLEAMHDHSRGRRAAGPRR